MCDKLSTTHTHRQHIVNNTHTHTQAAHVHCQQHTHIGSTYTLSAMSWQLMALFNMLSVSDAKNAVELQTSKRLVRSVRDPLIQDGKPLPNNGTCKHYKKSYRWLRLAQSQCDDVNTLRQTSSSLQLHYCCILQCGYHPHLQFLASFKPLHVTTHQQ